MNKQKFQTFIDSVKGYMSSQLETLSNLAETIENNQAESQPAVDASTVICGYLETNEVSGTSLTDEEYEALDAIASNPSDNFITNIVDGEKYVFHCEKGNDGWITVYNSTVSGESILFSIDTNKCVDDEVVARITEWNNTHDFDGTPSQLIEKVAAGRALPSALASLARFITSYGSDPSIDIIGGARNLLNQYKTLSGDSINTLISVVTGGASALIDYIQNTYLQLQSAMNDDPSIYFASTNIDVQNFSCGVILSSLGQIISTAAMVLVGISRIAAVIAGTIGGILSIIGQVSLKYASGYNDTLFTWDGTDQAKCFKFVVAQAVADCPYLARLMYQHNTAVCSIRSFETGSVIFARMIEPEKGVNSKVAMEEHLSIDFDVFKEIQYLTDVEEGPVFALNDLRDNVILTFQNDYELNYTKSGFARLYIETNSTPEHFDYTDLRLLGQSCYSPISLTLIDKLKDSFNEETTVCLYQRLMSALFLWSYAKFLASIKYSNIPTGYQSVYMQYTEIDGEYKCIHPFAAATRFIYLALKNGRTQGDNVPRLTGNDSTNLWNVIMDLFDGIPLSDPERTVELCVLYPSTETGATDISDPTDSKPVNLSFLTASGVPVLQGMFSYAFCVPTLGTVNIYTAAGMTRLNAPDYTEDSFSSAWPTNLGVNCPKLTFNAFLTGLIIDGIIVVTTIIVTAWMITAAVRFKRAARRASLDAEAATYAYTDAVNAGASSEVKQAKFKAFRRAELKSRVLNFSSGGIMQSASSESNENLSRGLMDIKKLICG